MPDPKPPDDVPAAVLESLQSLSPAQLRALSAYATALAEAGGGDGGGAGAGESGAASSPDADVAAASGDETSGSEGGAGYPETTGDAPDTPPEGVPGKATLTVKEINDNRYYYWQWREGDSVKSKYAGPVGGE